MPWQGCESPGTIKKTYYRSALVKAEPKPEVVTLNEGDLHRMLSDAPIMTAEQISSMKHAAEERKEQERAAARARKEKMLRLEEEARQQVDSPCTLHSGTAQNEHITSTCSAYLLCSGCYQH